MRDIETTVEEIRSRMREGAIPVVRVVLCNNGPRWGPDGDARIDAAGLASDEVQWQHVDHHRLVSLFRSQKSIDTVLDFHGAAHHEDLSFRRVFVGKVPVATIAELMSSQGDLLLERNIRRFLGLTNRVNARIAHTLRSPEERPNFYFYNNGLTMICRKLSFSSLRQTNFQVKVEGLQIINGGQTCKTIQQVLGEDFDRDEYADAFVMVRLYQLDEGDGHIGHAITFATNNQTPVELQDLRANDEIQQRLTLDLAELGYTYKTKRDNQPASEDTITSTQAANAVLTIWRQQPHLARFAERRLFDRYYSRIFGKNLNGAQIVLATRIFADVVRMLEELRDPKPFVPYATHYVAMACGTQLLMGHTGNPFEGDVSVIDHRSLPSLQQAWSEHGVRLVGGSLALIGASLATLGIDESSSLQRVAAQFRRADLLEPILRSLRERLAKRDG